MKSSTNRKKGSNLEAMVAGGQDSAYEALQLYKSKANRFKIKGDFDEAANVAACGCLIMLKHNYANSAEELWRLYFDALSSNNSEVNDTIRTKIGEINRAFEQNNSSRIEFLQSAVKYSSEHSPFIYGDGKLHVDYAISLWEEGDSKAIQHFAIGEAPQLLFEKISSRFAEHSQSTFLIQHIALGVVTFVALENLRDANELLRLTAEIDHSEGEGEGHKHGGQRLLQFCDMLVKVCERDAGPLFKSLCESFTKDLNFHSAIHHMLSGPIAKSYFNIVPPPNIMDMVSSMFGGGDI